MKIFNTNYRIWYWVGYFGGKIYKFFGSFLFVRIFLAIYISVDLFGKTHDYGTFVLVAALILIGNLKEIK